MTFTLTLLFVLTFYLRLARDSGNEGGAVLRRSRVPMTPRG